MNEISKQLSYLKGLAEGMAISEKSDEGRLISKLIDTIAAAGDVIDELKAKTCSLEAKLESLDEDVLGIWSDLDNIHDDMDDIGGDRYIDDDDDDDLFGYDDDEDGLFEITCPECGEDVVVDFDMLDDERNIECPNCHSEIELEFDVEDDDETEE